MARTGYVYKGFSVSHDDCAGSLTKTLREKGMPSSLVGKVVDSYNGKSCETGITYSHAIMVYNIVNPSWDHSSHFNNRLMTFPRGMLDDCFSVDLGHEMSCAIKGYREEVMDSKFEQELPDGSIVRGERIRQIPCDKGLSHLKNPFFTLEEEIVGAQYSYFCRISGTWLDIDNPQELRVYTSVGFGGSNHFSRADIFKSALPYSTKTDRPWLIKKSGSFRKM